MNILTKRLHPALFHEADKPIITYNTLLDEFIAAKAFGVEAYFNAPREWRMLMFGAQRTLDVIQTLTAYDAREAAKKKHGNN